MKNPFRSTRIFYNETLTELKKATWPTKSELRQSCIIVVIGMLLLGAYVSSVDASLFQVVDLFTDLVTAS